MSSAMQTFLSYLRVPVLASSGIAAVISGLLYFKQNEIIYPRNVPAGARTDVPKPSQFGITDFEELMIPTPDGESLSAFFIRPSNKQLTKNTTLLMFHGNAGNIGYRLPIARILEEDMGCNVLMLQYRGYGLSTGTPNEKGLMIDAQTGLDYIRRRAELRGTRIVLYGQSLGGAVSIGLASRNQKQGDIAGIILENTFTSIRKLIPSAFPPARYLAPLCHQIWPSEETLPQITNIPILFLSGLKDEIVP
ncbi:alpha/beta-hydrolase [Glonium stellatum]|uniref:Alpha/beta-hydrolase n=1 Tax=Glonium stellatum TaxID=574774 RepID=A0A8E2EWM1_9PEZI|nr:alpha/beta-hydrolase [Glonium stellatum]